MRILFTGSVIALFFTSIFSSCQKEVNETLDNPLSDSVEVIPMFRVVEIDNTSPGQDSLIRFFKTVKTNGQAVVVMSEIYPPFMNDSLNTVFSYNTQGQLSVINVSTSLSPAVSLARYRFTWNNNRLDRLVCDTFGVFANSIDFSYTASGANTVITPVNIPSIDVVTPDYYFNTRHTVTVNNQFVPVSERWVSHVGFPANPQFYHDTAYINYNYNGNDISSYDAYFSRHDTTGSGSGSAMLTRDTSQAVYGRSSMGANIADSLKKILGKEVYTMNNTSLLDLYYDWPVFIATSDTYYKQFYFRPLTSITYSKRVWINGIFEPLQSYSNIQEKKIVNSFDTQGRLTRVEIYQDFTFSTVEKTYKITY